MTLCHKKETIHYGTVSQEGEYPVWYFVTKSMLFQNDYAVPKGGE